MDKRISDLVEFEITEKTQQKIRADFLVNNGLPSFEGHFPGNPILPAVSIIDISLHLLTELRPAISHSDIQVKRSKFMAMVRPDQKVDISAESSDGISWDITWRLKENQSKLAQVNLVV